MNIAALLVSLGLNCAQLEVRELCINCATLHHLLHLAHQLSFESYTVNCWASSPLSTLSAFLKQKAFCHNQFSHWHLFDLHWNCWAISFQIKKHARSLEFKHLTSKRGVGATCEWPRMSFQWADNQDRGQPKFDVGSQLAKLSSSVLYYKVFSQQFVNKFCFNKTSLAGKRAQQVNLPWNIEHWYVVLTDKNRKLNILYHVHQI